jgi:hypothetical protein
LMPGGEYQREIQGFEQRELTGIRNDNVQPVGNLLDFFDCLLVTVLIICNELDDVHVNVLAGEFVQSVGSSRIPGASKDHGLGVTLDELFDEVESYASVRTGDYVR